jgi:hypothetical protein
MDASKNAMKYFLFRQQISKEQATEKMLFYLDLAT